MPQQETDQQRGEETTGFFDDTQNAAEREQAHRERGTVHPITVVGHPVLERECRNVTEFGPELASLIDDMFASQHAAQGVGLAANQIGVDRKVFVYDCPDDDGVRHVGVVCNPVLEELPADDRVLDDSNEGCLSVPTAYMEVPRPDYAVVRGQDPEGNPVRVEGTGYFARCLQHETDHLYGRLYLSRLSKRERKKVLKMMAEGTPRYETVPND